MSKTTDKYKHCNHHHEIEDDQELVNIGGCEFVADKKMIPLLIALNDLGLRTRTHNYSKGHSFVSIILDEGTFFELRKVTERNSSRNTFDGETEVVISWNAT